MNAPESSFLHGKRSSPGEEGDATHCRLLLVCGSLRRDSFNARLLQHLAQYLPCEFEMLEASRLPLFDQDLEADAGVLERVAALHRRFEAADGLVVASPEYNGMPTPYLKNTVDWVSRLPHIDGRFSNPFGRRPLLLCSASTGWSGGAVAMPHARALFGYVGCLVLGCTVCVPYAEQAWADGAYRFDPFFDAQIEEAAGQLFRLAAEFARSRDHCSEPA